MSTSWPYKYVFSISSAHLLKKNQKCLMNNSKNMRNAEPNTTPSRVQSAVWIIHSSEKIRWRWRAISCNWTLFYRGESAIKSKIWKNTSNTSQVMRTLCRKSSADTIWTATKQRDRNPASFKLFFRTNSSKNSSSTCFSEKLILITDS
jgi:hypothetical protein